MTPFGFAQGDANNQHSFYETGIARNLHGPLRNKLIST